MDWLKKENGVSIHNYGIIYGPAKFENLDQPPLLAKNESFSIELWLKPGSDDWRRFLYIFCLYDDSQPEIFSVYQVKSSFCISKYQNTRKRGQIQRWRSLKNTFIKGQKRFITITSDKNSTTIYLDGKKARRYRNFSLIPSKELTPKWRIVVGNDPTGKKPWTGKIYGLAIYNRLLSPKRVSEHFKNWRNGSALSLLKEKDIIALYPMDQQNGQLIQNAVLNQYHLSIPARFKILEKNFLELSGYAFNLNVSSLRDMSINILGFIPLGFLLLVTFYSTKSSWTSSWRFIFLAVFGGTVVSLIIEILQAYIPIRNSSLTDVIFNSFGTGLGVILAHLFFMIKRPRSGDAVI